MQWRLAILSLMIVAVGCQSAKAPKASEKVRPAVEEENIPKTEVEPPKQEEPIEKVEEKTEVVVEEPKSTAVEKAACIDATDDVCAIEAEIVRLTNEVRKRHNVNSELKHNPEIAFVSRSWSASMAKVFIINHFGFPSARQKLYREKFGNAVNLTAENVAMGAPQTSDPKVIAAYFVDMWENSRGHLKNMLGNHSNLGAGVVKGNKYYWYATQIFN